LSLRRRIPAAIATAQPGIHENSRLLGIFIRRIEQDATFAELDDKERAFISFCRQPARSRPRPMKADYEALVALGFAPLAVSEMAMLIALGCYYNRIGILIACPPELAFERVANGFLGRLVAPLMRMVMSMRKPTQPATLDAATLSSGRSARSWRPWPGCRGHDLQDGAG